MNTLVRKIGLEKVEVYLGPIVATPLLIDISRIMLSCWTRGSQIERCSVDYATSRSDQPRRLLDSGVEIFGLHEPPRLFRTAHSEMGEKAGIL